ncbi:unnamed protein product [Cylicostephanus goldi]|uniref:Uncharacterized protein n=1 Tax=Cylicostephanus goldi TaxID=71465 RepID=A0A3P7MTW2_CYLGO|nr:unnamed protein product [Cylicostephanus goldi]
MKIAVRVELRIFPVNLERFANGMLTFWDDNFTVGFSGWNGSHVVLKEVVLMLRKSFFRILLALAVVTTRNTIYEELFVYSEVAENIHLLEYKNNVPIAK